MSLTARMNNPIGLIAHCALLFAALQFVVNSLLRLTAPGHFDPFISHILTPAPNTEPLSINVYHDIQNVWGKQTAGASTTYGRTILKHLDRTAPRNPYLNIRVDTKLIADHNVIWGDEVQEFIRLLVLLATQDDVIE